MSILTGFNLMRLSNGIDGISCFSGIVNALPNSYLSWVLKNSRDFFLNDNVFLVQEFKSYIKVIGWKTKKDTSNIADGAAREGSC